MNELLTTAEVARRLGVKRETVYAYVSRGLLARAPASRRGRSLFDVAAVDALADGARRPNRSGAIDVTVRTELTALDPAGSLFYRGHNVVSLARHRSFEAVAGLLWDRDPGAPWRLDRRDRALLAAVRASLPADAAATDVIPVAVASLGAADHTANDRRPATIVAIAGRICAGAAAMLGADVAAPTSTAERLWRVLSTRADRAAPPRLAVVNASLVLMADHELSASALAARVAASAWADPYRVVLAGLGPLGGVLHGGASLVIGQVLAELESPDSARSALESLLASGPVPGFGHSVYRDRDPRADYLLERIPIVAVDPARARVIQALTDAARELGLPAPNADFALAALSYAMDLRRDAAATIFTVARIVGLIAHALEEYPHRLRFRPRATYLGTAPRA
ncbi:MAG: helix-turn-helix domain-containing protein [Solirubrobacterales bacterium]|nr:helix-turn-helix domain-containing protein [Solirubrobacterales bacterium]